MGEFFSPGPNMMLQKLRALLTDIFVLQRGVRDKVKESLRPQGIRNTTPAEEGENVLDEDH